MYGQEKWICEPKLLKRWAYRLLGEVHVPGRLRAAHIQREMERLGLTKSSLRMLDAGSGRGDLAIHLAKRFPAWQVVGLELEPEKVANSRMIAERLGLDNIEFRQGSLETFGAESSFDLIVNADVMEHIEDDRRVLANLYRALRPGGHIILTSPSVPQRKHLRLVAWRERRIGFQPSDYGHVRQGYSREDLEEKFTAVGARVTRSYLTFGFFGTLAFDLFFVIGDNRPHPVVFALMFPFLMLLAGLDLAFPSKTGSAILAVASK